MNFWTDELLNFKINYFLHINEWKYNVHANKVYPFIIHLYLWRTINYRDQQFVNYTFIQSDFSDHFCILDTEWRKMFYYFCNYFFFFYLYIQPVTSFWWLIVCKQRLTIKLNLYETKFCTGSFSENCRIYR